MNFPRSLDLRPSSNNRISSTKAIDRGLQHENQELTMMTRISLKFGKPDGWLLGDVQARK